MKRNYFGLLLLVSLAIPRPARAAGFLSTGPGSRAAGLGGAFTGLADAGSAAFYNPAGLAGQRGGLTLEHVPISDRGSGLAFGDGRLDFFGVQYPSRLGTFALAVYQFAIGGIEARGSLADPAANIGASQTAYFIPYAVNLGRVSVGATAKAVTYALGNYRGSGYGGDLGAKTQLYRADTRLGRDTQVFAGLAIRNAAAPVLTLFRDPAALERVTALGLGGTALVREHYDPKEDRVLQDRVTAALDIQRGNLDTPLSVAAGLEYSYLGRFAVRGGYSANGEITVGIGLTGSGDRFRFDYGAGITALAPQHRFTVSWFFSDPPASIESDVRLSAYRRAALDQARLKARFIREGRAAAVEGRYEEAFAAFAKAQVLDPGDREVARLVESAGEGSRLAGVKTRLDAARREQAAGNGGEAAKFALNAVLVDPDSRDAADYSAQLRNDLISSGTVVTFDLARRSAVDLERLQFDAAYKDRSLGRMRRILGRMRALAPDDAASWKTQEDSLRWSESYWAGEYAKDAADALRLKKAVAMARAIRRLARVDPRHMELRPLGAQLRKLSRNAGGSFYAANYLQQLYYAAAADYVLGNYDSAVQKISVLLGENATHEDANALVSRMRDEGTITEVQEP